MNHDELIAQTKRFYQLLVTDFDACLACLADDFVIENYLPEGIPFGGRYAGGAWGLTGFGPPPCLPGSRRVQLR